MFHAILFTTAGHAKFQLRIAEFGPSANGTFMKRFGVGSRKFLKLASSGGDVVAMLRFREETGPKENEIITERGDERRPIRVRADKEADEQEASRDPGEPFYPHGQNEKDVNDFLGIEMRKGKEERHQEHRV